MEFNRLYKQDQALAAAADIAVREVLKLREDERVIIVTNPEPEVSDISMALYDAVLKQNGRPLVMYQPMKTQLDFADDAVYGAISSEPDVVLSISSEKMGKDRKGMQQPYGKEKSIPNLFHYLMDEAKTVRSFWSPNVTKDMFIRTVPIDYGRLREEAGRLKDLLDKAVSVRVTNAKGTDIRIGIENRISTADDGDFSRPGSGGNLPAGETFISPVVGTSEGTIVFDGSISSHSGVIVIRQPIEVQVEKGFITTISGGEEAETLKESIRLGEENARLFEQEGKLPLNKGALYARNARNIGELGIGLNPAAEIRGNMLEDEKAYKTCHIALGSNYDDDAPALIHLDGLITEPTIIAVLPDGKEVTLLKDGDLIR